MRLRATLTGAFVIFAVLLPANFSVSAQDRRPMNFTDVVSLKRVSNPQLSPNGESILIDISEADWKENKTISHIYRIRSDGSGLVQMTNGKDGERGGIWSPDGQTIAFITEREDEQNQIYLLNNNGGEAIRLSDHDGGINAIRWAPDGKSIYFIATDPKSKEEKEKEKKKDDAFLFEKDWKHRHLWSIDVDSKAEKRLTEGDFTVRYFSLSRDGKKVVLTKTPTPLYDDVLKAEINIYDLAAGEMNQVTSNRIYESYVELSPDGRFVLFFADSNQNLDDHYFQSTLFLVPATGGSPKMILPDFKPEVLTAAWSNDGQKVYFTANMGVHAELFSVTIENGRIEQLTDGRHAIYGFDYRPEIDRMVYLINSPHNPGSLWMAEMRPFFQKQVYDPFEEDLKSFELARVESVSWPSIDGYRVEGVLIYPLGYEEGKRYPLLAHTHGGPMSSDKLTFDGYSHARAGRGYAILKPNYRGSTGYGNEVLRDMVGHYFNHADDDVITGVQFLVAKGIADPDHLGTLGWSAGGHMTNWLITETDIFKAASSGAGASNWISMYSQSDVRIYRTPWFLGNPWQENSPLETFRHHSPIFRIHQARTPTLILVGENDNRVPMPQSVELYRGLKANGIPTELVVFPRSGHGPRELQHRLYKMNKEFHWLEKYITGREFEYDKAPKVEEEKE